MPNHVGQYNTDTETHTADNIKPQPALYIIQKLDFRRSMLMWKNGRQKKMMAWDQDYSYTNWWCTYHHCQ